MHTIKVNLTEVEGALKRAEEEFAALPAEMLARVRRGAAYERSTHAYRNRTGNLQASTQATQLESSSRSSAVALEMTMDYASFVNNRGLSNIDEAAHDVDLDLLEMFEEMAARIAGTRR